MLIDCPPSLGLLTLNALVAGEEMLIPIQAEYYALEGLGQLLETVEMVRKHLNPRLEVSTILITMYDARTRLAAGVADEVRDHFGETGAQDHDPAVGPGLGGSVVRTDGDDLRPGSSGALSYLEAAREMAAREQAHERQAMPDAARLGSALPHRSGRARRGRARGSRRTSSGPAPRRGSRRVDRRGGTAPPAGGRPPQAPGAYFAELPVAAIRRTPAAAPGLRGGGDGGAGATPSGRSGCSSRSWSDADRRADGYELIMGERRWRASQEAGLETIPAIVRETDDNDMLRDALLENLHRSQLNPLEEAAAYGQLLEDFGCTHDELAERIGRSRPQISNTLRLLKLSPAVQRRVAAGVLCAGHARALLAVEDADLQDRLAQRVVAEGISVRGLEEIVAVGDHGEAGSPPVRREPTAPGLAELADRLSDRFETRVKVDLGKSKGKITVEFASWTTCAGSSIMDLRNRDDRPI